MECQIANSKRLLPKCAWMMGRRDPRHFLRLKSTDAAVASCYCSYLELEAVINGAEIVSYYFLTGVSIYN